MRRTWGLGLQAAAVCALFLGALATVLYSTFQALYLPQREFVVHDRLREAGHRLAAAAELEFRQLPGDEGQSFDALNEKLRAISDRVLSDYPGVEGGFYLGEGSRRFAGFGFPTEAPPALSPPPANAGRPISGDEPPPKERPVILAQAEVTLSSGEVQFEVRPVGPSRVALLTEAVGTGRPARCAAWTMFRLVSPESQERQLRQFQTSTGLALGGMALAGLLTLNLGKRLKRQRLEQEQLREELRRSEHLAALGKLLAGVAHEVRNPLAGIRSTVQLWDRLPETTRSPGSLHAVIQAVDRLNEIVNRLLYFARVDQAERRPLSVSAVVHEILCLLEAQASSQSVVIERDLAPDLPSVLGSATALRQVFLNLAANALQAMPQGGRLLCQARYQASNRTVEVHIRDTGPGISAENRKHLFEPFFTTRPDGTGLGLALCRDLVLQHGGQIELENDGPGATFKVVLPASP